MGRSKSGGAHVYFFFKDALKAEFVQSKLTELAASLGHAEGEIFPKQSTILVDRGDTGNGLNMPYFKGDFSTRSVYDFKGELMSPEEFVKQATKYLITPENFSAVIIWLFFIPICIKARLCSVRKNGKSLLVNLNF